MEIIHFFIAVHKIHFFIFLLLQFLLILFAHFINSVLFSRIPGCLEAACSNFLDTYKSLGPFSHIFFYVQCTALLYLYSRRSIICVFCVCVVNGTFTYDNVVVFRDFYSFLFKLNELIQSLHIILLHYPHSQVYWLNTAMK